MIKERVLKILRIILHCWIIASAGLMTLSAQHSSPDTIIACYTNESIRLDGVLDEQAWQSARKVSNFTQRELNNGQGATERTEAAILYNDKYLYIGIWCYDSQPDKILAKNFIRDYEYGSEDNFELILDTYNDKRNGYLFVINPNGARFDAQSRDEGENINSNWNGVWDAATKINEKGWFAEIEIPFSTLQFRQDSVILWGINLERNIRYKQEQLLWQGWSRDYELEKVSKAGTLAGLKNIAPVHNIELKPYVLMGAQKGNSDNFIKKMGCDLISNITPTVKANLTINTDFAQVDADKLQVNLSRFSLYYPEKREFFLENADLFSIYLGNSNQLFYSRRIGLSGFEQVPILAGGRVVGKINSTDFGAFSIQTDRKDSLPTANYTVLRIKQDVLDQSNIGAIIESRVSPGKTNLVYAIDGNYVSSKLFGDKNLVIGGVISQCFNDGNAKDNLAVRAFVDYPNDLIDTYYGYSQVQENYDPQIGFLQRRNFRAFNGQFYFMPRWLEDMGIKQFVFKPYEYSYYWTDSSGKAEGYVNEVTPLGFTTKSGETFHINIQQMCDRLDQTFNLTNSIAIPAGKYYFNPAEILFSTYSGRQYYAELIYSFGPYYSGYKRSTDLILNGVFFNRLNASLEWINNYLEFGGTKSTIDEVSATLRIAISTRLNISIFSQYISDEKFLSFNCRLHWIPVIGSDFYLVYNQGNDENFRRFGDILRPSYSVGMFKLVWRFAI